MPNKRIRKKLRGKKYVTVGIARLEPTDVIVMECKEEITSEDAHFMFKELKRAFPNNNCLILANGMELRIVSEDKINGRPNPEV